VQAGFDANVLKQVATEIRKIKVNTGELLNSLARLQSLHDA
jgi:hypothetical protein